jgi:hypothetical protein
MTRTNKRIKRGNTRKIKKIITILQLYPNICRLYTKIPDDYQNLIEIYKIDNQKQSIERQKMQWPKEKGQNGK